MSAPRGRTDTGSALPMVLGIITVIAVVAGALLGQASTHFKATTTFEDKRNRVLAADSGLEIGFSRTSALSLSCTNSESLYGSFAVGSPAVAVDLYCRSENIAWGSNPSQQTQHLHLRSVATQDGIASTATAVLRDEGGGTWVPVEWVTADG